MNGPEAVLIGSGGALLAALGAMAASPLFPIGVARHAEPSPGLHIDWAVVLLGVIVVTAVVVLISFLAALRITRSTSVVVAAPRRRRRITAPELAARVGLAPTATIGLSMAVEPGSGRTAVPVRSAFFGAVVGVVGVTAVIVFASSLNHIVRDTSTLRRYVGLLDPRPHLEHTMRRYERFWPRAATRCQRPSRRFATTTAFKSMDAP